MVRVICSKVLDIFYLKSEKFWTIGLIEKPYFDTTFLYMSCLHHNIFMDLFVSKQSFGKSKEWSCDFSSFRTQIKTARGFMKPTENSRTKRYRSMLCACMYTFPIDNKTAKDYLARKDSVLEAQWKHIDIYRNYTLTLHWMLKMLKFIEKFLLVVN